MCVPSFNLLDLTVPEKGVMKNCNVENWRERKNEEIEGWISSSSLILVYMIHLPTVHACTKFQSSRPHSSREKCDKKFQCWELVRKKNEEIKACIRSSSLIPVYMIHLHTAHVSTKFQTLGLTVPKKSVTKNSNVWKVNWTSRFHYMTTENLILQQGHVTPKWLIRSGQNSNLSEILCLSWLPASLTKIRQRMNELAWRHHFPIISLWEIFQMLKGS